VRYLLIDKIDVLEPGERIVATKCVAMSEDVFSYHFVGRPVMPGALLIESLAQAGTALLEYADTITKKAILVMVERAKFRAIVQPGQTLRVEATVTRRDGDLATLDGAIYHGDRPVVDATLVFVVADAGDFYPEHMRVFVKASYDNLLREAEIKPPGGGEGK